MSIASQAFIFDGQISIDRALNSPTLTVRYSNANAALVELRVNGESVATRTVNAAKNSGETTFNLNLASLNNGDNKVEIRLFDKAGKLLATESTGIETDNSQSPVFLTAPKMGASLRGRVDIKVGFAQPIKNSYVSFFIDNQLKSMSNVPPFEFNWDTTRDTNGWHEIEAWVVDDSNPTMKTRTIRVFVQNPAGNTPRQPAAANPAPVVKQPVVKTPVALVAKAPTTSNVMTTIAVSNTIHTSVAGTAGTKPANLHPSVASGLKEMLPTGTRLAKVQKTVKAPPVNLIKTTAAAAETGLVSITRGQRLPNIGSFAIVFNTQFVDFDVQPRVSEGVPLTPFRHLIEKAGGKVDWAHKQKTVTAQSDTRSIFFHIGDSFAEINKQRVELERASFIESGRAIVPLSFMRDALDVNIDYDKATGHVLITSIKK